MQTITCIPGTWLDRKELVLSIPEQTDGRYLFAGQVLMNVETKESAEIEFCLRDERMHKSFIVGGQGQYPVQIYDEIKSHRGVIYLKCDIDGLSNLHKLHTFINVCLVSGGLGVKFENSGVAHTARQWNGYEFRNDTLLLMRAHVIMAYSDDYFYSCGMHIFGLPDVAVKSTIPNNSAGYMLTEFNYYHIFESPNFKEGQTFSTDKDSPKYRIKFRDDFIYKGEELFENPYGRIELEKCA